MKKTMLGILVGAAALAHAPPEASAAMIVDSDRNFFSTRFAVFAEPDGGQALAQSFTLDADFELDSLSVYAKGDAASLYIVEALAPSLTRGDMIWSTDFSASAFDWQTFSLDGLTLAAGEYFLVMESDSPITGGVEWVSSTSTSRVNLGSMFNTPFETGDFAASSPEVVENKSNALTLRISGAEVVIPAPGAATMAGVFGLAALRRRRR